MKFTKEKPQVSNENVSLEKKMQRSILHMDLDSFFVSVERILNPELNGKPVIIGSPTKGVVSSCSYEARKFGVHSAMPGATAHKLCPQAIFVFSPHNVYGKYSRMVTKIIEAEAPLFEKASIDEHYIDITGMDTFFNSVQFAKNLKDKIKNETGLPISFGLSTSKTLAKMATNAGKPNGEFVIEPGKEKEFLAPLTVNKIPGVGKKTYETLVGYGIEKIGTIQQMSCDKMEQMLGEIGNYIWKKSNAICNSQVVTTREQKSMSTERTFSENTSDPVFLKAKLMSMVSELCFDLRKNNKLTSCVAIKIRYSNFDTATFQTTIDYTSTDDYILKKVLELFHKNVTPHRALRLIGVKFSNLSDGEYQLNLFDDNCEKQKLYSALDNIRNKFGIKSIARAETLATKKNK